MPESAPLPTRSAPCLYNLATGRSAATPMVEIAPGQWTAGDIHPDDVPRYGLVRMMRQIDGRYLPVLKQHSQYVRMSHDLPELLGLKGLSPKTLYRIIAAGFVASARPAPNVILVDLLSLTEHVQAARDPEFWTDPRRRRWSDAIAEIH